MDEVIQEVYTRFLLYGWTVSEAIQNEYIIGNIFVIFGIDRKSAADFLKEYDANII